MGRALAACAPLALCLLLAGCGGDALLLFPGQSAAPELSLDGPRDGVMLTHEGSVSVQVQGPESSSPRDLVMEVTLVSAAGEPVLRDKVDAPALNEDISVELPAGLQPGQYRLEISLLEGGQEIQKRSTTLFAAKELPTISVISSFPPVISASAHALLRAELTIPQGTDPYLRWSWRGRTISRGAASEGAAEFLWTAPSEEGVYTVTLEIFPSRPAEGVDFAFQSSVAMATDIYVTSTGKEQAIELSPAASYWSLFHLRATLEDTGAGVRGAAKREATAIGTPKIIPADDGFAYRLDGSSGFSAPRLVLPVEDGSLGPFTVSVGIQPERLADENRILQVEAKDDGFAFLVDLDKTGSPEARLTVGARVVSLPSLAPPLPFDRRSLLSISFIPGRDQSEARWFIDGKQVASTRVPVAAPTLHGQGSLVVGGEHGVVGAIDEVGVYYRDPQGRPAPDGTLFSMFVRRTLGDSLLAAEGFDGVYLPAGFTVGNDAKLSAGSLVLPAGNAVELPGILPADGCTISFVLAEGSAAEGLLQLSWEGSDAPLLETAVVAEAGAFLVTIVGETVTAMTPEGSRSWPLEASPAKRSGLLVRLAAPRGEGAPLSIAEVLALRSPEKE